MFCGFSKVQYNYYDFFIIRGIYKRKVDEHLVNLNFRFSSISIKQFEFFYFIGGVRVTTRIRFFFLRGRERGCTF